MHRRQSTALALLFSLFTITAAAASASDGRTVTAEGAGVAFAVMLPAGYELQGVGPEWYVVEAGTTRPLVLVKFQMGKTVDGIIAEGFEAVEERRSIEFPDGATGTIITGAYQAPAGKAEEYTQPWYLHPAPGRDGIFMLAEYRAMPWSPFEQFAKSFRYTP
ncbi:MAG: hypothetical protein U5K73_06500 [Halofilum sp. (in: g-proteobacteria)]|nr:hypothetical protein [Halofilum sp. (in: g-proteobacteria)]